MAEGEVPAGLLEPDGGIGVNPFIISILLQFMSGLSESPGKFVTPQICGE
jgi:hypothetical protein